MWRSNKILFSRNFQYFSVIKHNLVVKKKRGNSQVFFSYFKRHPTVKIKLVVLIRKRKKIHLTLNIPNDEKRLIENDMSLQRKAKTRLCEAVR